MYTIGIDIGTTSICGVVLNIETGKIENIQKINNDSWIKTGNCWEHIQDVKLIEKYIRGMLENLLKTTSSIKGIGITGQMHGIIYLDKKGTALSPLYTWQDNRSGQLSGNGLTYTDELKVETGSNIYPGYGLATHYYNLVNNLVPASAKYISTISDYIAMSLSEGKKPFTDCNNAAGFGFFDLENLQFDVSLIKKAGIDISILPEIVSPGREIGSYKNQFPIVCATGDNQASILGSTNNIRESVNVNIGTGGQVNIFSSKNIEIEGIETRPFFGSGYLLLGASLCGGSAYSVLEEFFRKTAEFLKQPAPERIYDIMDEVCWDAGIKEEEKIKACTTFFGTRTVPSSRGSINNISYNNLTPQGMVIAFQEGIVQELYSYYRLIKESTDIRPVQLVGSGNGIRKNKLIRYFVEKFFNLPVKLTVNTEETASGAAITAAVGLGFYKDFLNTDTVIKYC